LPKSGALATNSGGFGVRNQSPITKSVFKEDKKKKRRSNCAKVKRSPIILRTRNGANRNEDIVLQEDRRKPVEVSVQGVRVTIECGGAGQQSETPSAEGTTTSEDTPTESTIDDDECL
jgi:hypothetical protein